LLLALKKTKCNQDRWLIFVENSNYCQESLLLLFEFLFFPLSSSKPCANQPVLPPLFWVFQVGSSEATLCAMLGIKPFFYGMSIVKIYDNGDVYDRKVLELKDDDIAKMFEAGIANVTGLSLGTGITTEASLPHVLANAFKNCLAVTFASDNIMESCNGVESREVCFHDWNASVRFS